MIDILAVILSPKGLNLVVVIGALVYVSKNKLIHFIDDMRKKEKKAVQDIKKNQKQLDADYNLIQEDSAVRKIYGQSLLKKIELWNQVLQEQEYHKNTECYRIQQTSARFIKNQTDFLATYVVYKEIAPKIVATVQEIVQSDFKDTDKQEVFLEQSYKFLEDQL